MTKATRELASIVMFDSAKIAKYNSDEKPVLYTDYDVEKTLSLIEVVKTGEPFKIGQFKATLRDAGHILGSTSVELLDTKTKKKFVFSGDLGNSPQELVKPTELISKADVVIMESTYGGREHPDQKGKDIIASEIKEAEKAGSTLLIPAFSIERTQVLLHIINHLKSEHKIGKNTQVFLDAPMGIKATYVYKNHPELYNDHLRSHAQKEDPFDFDGLKIIKSGKKSKKIIEYPGTKIIIAGSGMMTGGRIVRHAADFLPNQKTRLLIVGYQGEQTLGREIIEGAKEVEIEGQSVPVRAHVEQINSMSAHADEPKLLDWLHAIKGVKKVILTHGEDESRQALSTKISHHLKISDVQLPTLNQELEV